MKVKNLTRFYVFLLGVILVVLVGGVLFFYHFYQAGKEIRNVLLISIDTCRADYLSCYGYSQKTTPNIDAIAEEGVLFENVISPVPITLPAHSSMLTGTIPPYHGVHDNSDYQLDQSNVTLAEILKHSGFTTGGIISAFVLISKFCIDQGFDTYIDQFEQERKTVGYINERIGAETSRFALNWLDQHKNEKFFLFLHYFDPHRPYIPPEPFASEFAGNPYAGEIAYADHCIGLVLSKLKKLGLYDSTLIIITADHGEMLGEHGESDHLYFIYQSAIKVPLIFKLPGQRKSKRIEDLVGIIDIVPTVCSLLGIQPPKQHVQGQDLSLCLFGKGRPDRNRHIYCESLFATRYNGNSLLGVVTNRYKYIQTTRPELYDLTKDPHETNNLIKLQAQRGRILKGRLKQILEQTVRKDELDSRMELDARSREQLESLGYVRGRIIEDFDFDQTREDPKDLIDFHNLNLRVTALIYEGKYGEAKVSAEMLVEKGPGCHIGYEKLADIARRQKDYSEAAVYLKKVIELNPNYDRAHNNLGLALQSQGKFDEAISHFQQALLINPAFDTAHNNLGLALQSQGKPDEAISHFRQALQINIAFDKAHNNLGLALASGGKLDEAISHFTETVRLNPGSAEAHYLLASALNDTGRTAGAVTHFRETLRREPDWFKPMNSLAWILATDNDSKLRNPAEAVRLAERTCELTKYEDAGFVDTLAAAYASAGRFTDAAATAEKALKLIEPAGDKERIENIQNRLELYRQKKAYRQQSYIEKSPE
ncbi:MAG: sulfatase-like hydrolase/transferase [Planctomycetota bacterium]|jgi:arylsulfatase A-like enzyme/Flp pilus assembly protein TadD